MRNKIFQALWYLIKGIVKRKEGSGLSVSDYSDRLFFQLKLARIFGSPELILIGDSNSEAFSNQDDMSQFDCLAVGLGIGGTRADQWLTWFQSSEGRRMQEMFGEAKVVWNIGGNHVLQEVMGNAEDSLKGLKELFPESWNIVIPPIHHSILTLAGLDGEETQLNVEKINGMIRDVWSTKVIDLYNVFVSPAGEAYPGLLSDPVHYGPEARKIIGTVIKKSIGC